MKSFIRLGGSTININSIFKHRIVVREFFLPHPYRVEVHYNFNSLARGHAGSTQIASVNCATYDDALEVYLDVCERLKDDAKKHLEELEITIATLKEKQRLNGKGTKISEDE